jgi:hypothetical protein
MVVSKEENTGIVRSIDPTAKPAPKKDKPNLKYQRDKDREPVKGIFRFYEAPGGTLSFCFRAYKEDPIEQFALKDGEVYTLPLGVAKHLNKTGWYPEYEFFQGEKNVIGAFSPDGHIMRVARKVRRYGFQSLEFVDTDDMGTATDIVEVNTYHKTLGDIGKVI